MSKLSWLSHYFNDVRKFGFWAYTVRLVYRQFYRRVLKADMKMSLPNKSKIILPDWSGFSSVTWRTRGWADDRCETVMEICADSERWFVDLGAHFGYWGVWMSHVSKGVIAVEPNPICHEVLKQNLNNTKNLIVPSGVSDVSDQLRFFADASPPYSKFVAPDEVIDRPGRYHDIEVKKLDAIWHEANKVPVWGIKIDTEGHEYAALKSADAMLQECNPIILMETDIVAFGKISELKNLSEYSYGWLSSKTKNQRQSLFLGDTSFVTSNFAEGMLFAFPPNCLTTQNLNKLENTFNLVR